MQLFILRHEDRTQDCSFFSPLTEKGLNNSVKLIEILKKINIDTIYSSPFIRTLQTIYPYSKKYGIKINIEYGLSEIHHEDIIPKKAVGIELPEYLINSFNNNNNYKRIMEPTSIIYPEKYEDVVVRTKKVLRDIIKNYYHSNKKILLVTHQSLCSTILKIINKNSKLKGTLSTKNIDNYEKGKLCFVLDSKKGWLFKELN